MRYAYRVRDIGEYDTELLAKQIALGGLPIPKRVVAGNAMVIMDFDAKLVAGEVETLRSIVTSHSPVWFTWADDLGSHKRIVSCAEDVDRITAQRIRQTFGGEDPIQEQLKITRNMFYIFDVLMNQGDYTAGEAGRARVVLGKMRALNNKVESIRQEGIDFKTTHNWRA